MLVAWLRRPKVVWSAVTERLEQCGSVHAAAGEAPVQGSLFDVTSTDDLEKAAADVERWERAGIRLVTVLDPEYPSNLRMIYQRPPVLFLRGTTDARDATSVAVVGTRKASPRGLDQARELAAGLAARNIPVISGLAAGIDTAAHTAALAADGRTVAVIGTGIDRVYPAQNARLQEEIAAKGLVISQFLPGRTTNEDVIPHAQCGDERVRARDGRCRGRIPERRTHASAACASARAPCLPHAQPARARLGTRLRAASGCYGRGQRPQRL